MILRSLLAALAAFVAVPVPAAEPAPAPREAALKIFDGKPKTVVCVTNSHAGGRQLDQKLKRYFGGNSPITVKFTTGWSTPVDARTGAVHAGSWLDTFSLAKEKEAGNPVIVIALSGVELQRPAVKGQPVVVNDETVKLGVDTLGYFVAALKAKGAAEVFVSTYHHFETHDRADRRGQYDEAFAPKVFAAYNEKTKANRAIDCLPLTRKHHPLTIGADEFHPSKAGYAVYSHLWFEALLKHDGLDVPAWSAEEMDAALKSERDARAAPKRP
ncbi:MAG: hypothetical protein C0501_18925 [Isosphaera sp.]|nr:hypothetical protein [Isosphaera sp.]